MKECAPKLLRQQTKTPPNFCLKFLVLVFVPHPPLKFLTSSFADTNTTVSCCYYQTPPPSSTHHFKDEFFLKEFSSFSSL